MHLERAQRPGPDLAVQSIMFTRDATHMKRVKTGRLPAINRNRRIQETSCRQVNFIGRGSG
eukprot:759154-Hanusia_phi.AAC.7